MASRLRAALLVAAAVGAGACVAEGEPEADMPTEEPAEITLGPKDGHDLPGTDLDRVTVGGMAPDFSAASLAGPVVTLSEFRGQKNVVLFFYRGHW